MAVLGTVPLTKQIHAHAKSAQWEEAVVLLRTAEEEQLQVDRVMLGACISACHRAAQWRPGLALLTNGARQRLADGIAYNMVMGSCEQSGAWEQTLELMKLRENAVRQQDSGFGLRSTISTLRRRDVWQMVLRLYEAATQRQREDVEMNSVLRAYESATWWRDATQLLEHGMTSLPSSKDYAIALRACAAAGQVPQTLQMMERLRAKRLAELRMYTTAVTGCVEGTDWQAALWLFSQAASEMPLDQKFYEVTLGACNLGGQWQLAIDLLDQCDFGPERSGIFYFNKALASCKGAWTVALQLLSEAAQRSVQRNVGSYREVMNACASGRAWMTAIELLRFAPLDLPLRRLAQRAVGRARPRAALQLLRQMRLGRCAEREAFNDAMGACKASWRVVLEILDEMKAAKLSPDQVTYLAMVQAFKGPRKWMLPGVFEEAEAAGVEMLPKAYKLSIRACTEAAQWQQALIFFRDAQARFSLDAGFLSMVSKYSYSNTLQLMATLRSRRVTPAGWLQRQAVKTLEASAKPWEAKQFSLTWATWEGALQLLSSWQEALELLSLDEKMSYVALRFCASSYAWPQALALLPSAVGAAAGSVADADAAYAVTLRACEEALEWPQALALLSDMKRVGRRRKLLPEDDLLEMLL